MKRLFIAVPVTPGNELLQTLTSLKVSLRDERIHWVAPGNLHFTLQFLGDTRDEKIPLITEKLNLVALETPVTEGVLCGVDHFSQKGVPRVLFVRLENMPGIKELAYRIQERMNLLGIAPDTRDFKPHLTIARIKYLKNIPRFINLINSLSHQQFQKTSLDRIVLYQSILSPEGPVYKTVQSFELHG